MIKKKTEVKEHLVREEVVTEVHLTCDVCGREVLEGQRYWMVRTQHHEWANDWVDSIEENECCSVACVKKHVEDFCAEVHDEPEVMINGKRFYKRDYGVIE